MNDDETAVLEPASVTPVARVEERAAWAEPGSRLGRYLVIGTLGRGGMGLVLRAYDPKLQREVALKLLRTRTLDERARERLVREARAMARLSHPNVVAVYDVELELELDDDPHRDPEAGVGVVMEYVEGTTLGTWLDESRPTVAQILAAFVAAGRGLAAAHAQQLLHRDFKLDNVLRGADGRVRVTDFGLARATTEASSEAAASLASSGHDDDSMSAELTMAGTVMGTPAYMPPEQARGDELDPRADQYALCVALWRALTGQWPFAGRGDELQAAKRAGPPSWPAKTSVPRHVTEAIRRGLAAEPADRWPTLTDLLEQLRRDPSLRRRQMFALGLVAVAGVGALGWRTVSSARHDAACEDEGAQIAAVYDAARADRIGEAFTATKIAYADDTWTRARARFDAFAGQWTATRTAVCREPDPLDAEARACLDEQADAVDALLRQLAEPDAQVVLKAATASASLADPSSCDDEVTLRQRAEPPDDEASRAEVRRLRARLAEAAAARATGAYEVARTEAVAVLDDAKTLGWAPLTAEAKLALAVATAAVGDYEAARGQLQDAFVEAGTVGRDAVALAAATQLVSVVGSSLAQHDAGLQWGAIAQMLLQRLDRTDTLDAAALQTSLGRVHLLRGELDEALALNEQALEIRTRVLGEEHPDVAGTLNNIGGVYAARSEYGKALEYSQRVLEVWERTLGPEHPDVALMLSNVGNGERARRNYDEALRLHRRALEIRERSLGPEHPDVAASLNNMCNLYEARAELEPAKASCTRSLAISEKRFGPEHPDVALPLANLGNVHRKLGELPEAHAALQRALDIWTKVLGPDHHMIGAVLDSLGDVRLDEGDAAGAVADLTRALEIFAKTGASEYELAARGFDLGRAQWAAGDREEGRRRVRAAAEAHRAHDATDDLAEVQAWLDEHTP